MLLRSMETGDWNSCWLECSYLAVDKSCRCLKTVYQATHSCLQNVWPLEVVNHVGLISMFVFLCDCHHGQLTSSTDANTFEGQKVSCLQQSAICSVETPTTWLIRCVFNGFVICPQMPYAWSRRGFFAHASAIWLMPPFVWKKGWKHVLG